ncbi:chromate efflux transporter [Geomonas sp. RF6]|uniref:chromate efflux transporter n=1 Tax=Geomonas sp. RF6 TaxID=2897342 RepID=UPI001E46FE01|nr:chromate efflux transporter [Geomonas sp. RF6]UFS70141.1 chromate efflux transporter [Geomonas sp. RF6]
MKFCEQDLPVTETKEKAEGGRELFWEFLKLGCTAFGGPAIIAHVRELAVVRKKWVDAATFKDGVVLSQSIPGATAMQVAAYVGLKAQGVRGAALAYLGLGLPAFFLMLLLSRFYAASRSITEVVSLFGGLQVIVVSIVAHAACTFGKDIVKSVKGVAIALLCAGLLYLKINAAAVIGASALVGMVIFRATPATSPVPEAGDSTVRKRVVISAACVGVGLAALWFAHPRLFTLSARMLEINFLAFGGGLSALPLMHHEFVSRGWLESKAFIDGIALGQVTPGPISITGTFIGYLLFGVAGAVAATLATFSPSFILLILSEPYFARLKSSQLFACASRGIMACFVGLLFYVTYQFSLEIPWDAKRGILALVAFCALLRKVDLLLVVFAGAAFSLALL